MRPPFYSLLLSLSGGFFRVDPLERWRCHEGKFRSLDLLDSKAVGPEIPEPPKLSKAFKRMGTSAH